MCQSLGVIIWQFATGEVPYNISHQVLPQDALYPKLLSKIELGEGPGEMKNDLPRELRAIIMQCWDRNPLLRPTADVITNNLLDIKVALASMPQPDIVTFPSISAISDWTGGSDVLRRVQEKAFTLINQARQLNMNPSEFKQCATTLPKEEFHMLQERGIDFQPVDAFLVGGLVWWNMLDTHVLRGIATEDETAADASLYTTEEGKAPILLPLSSGNFVCIPWSPAY